MDTKKDTNAAEITNRIKIVSVSSGETSTATKPIMKRTAKKSTVTQEVKTSAAVTRRQSAVVNSRRNNLANDKFLENFDPESSVRERRKITRKVYTANRKVPGAMYDEKGVHINSGIDLCDCFNLDCPGCHFSCPKCGSNKCGSDCRCNRRYVYDQIEYHGCDLIIKNPLNK